MQTHESFSLCRLLQVGCPHILQISLVHLIEKKLLLNLYRIQEMAPNVKLGMMLLWLLHIKT